jgi:hypothetical protein
MLVVLLLALLLLPPPLLHTLVVLLLLLYWQGLCRARHSTQWSSLFAIGHAATCENVLLLPAPARELVSCRCAGDICLCSDSAPSVHPDHAAARAVDAR